jgi:D-aspartate ligase
VRRPLACVMGDMDLLRPLGLAGIPCAVAAAAGAPPRYSRFKRATVPWFDPWEHAHELVDGLLQFASAQPERPVLFYEEDGDLLVISRHRGRLARAFRFVIADAPLVEALVDKAAFQDLAQRFDLPVPRARLVAASAAVPPESLDLRFPVIVKPLTRRPSTWAPIGGGQKAVRVASPAELRALWPRIASTGLSIMVQELVPGEETAIESYHVYAEPSGEIVADFTGKKVRTFPEEYGDSTALIITDAADVQRLGRDLVRRLKLAGVAKFDFKRAPDGRLYLLEINPRFTLWHHPGALAGVNIPALVYSDLCGLARPFVAPARAGVSWCRVWQDIRAARQAGMSFGAWARWAYNCDAKSAMAWDDPMPFLGAVMWRGVRAAMPARRTQSRIAV